MTHEDKQKLAEQIAEKAMSFKNVTYAVVLQAVYEALNARDEEINALHDLLDTYERELDQLRNPWISAEDRLPERIHNNCDYSVECLIHCYDKEAEWNTVAQYNYAQHCWDLSDYDYSYETVVQFWIPIPELKKGE